MGFGAGAGCALLPPGLQGVGFSPAFSPFKMSIRFKITTACPLTEAAINLAQKCRTVANLYFVFNFNRCF